MKIFQRIIILLIILLLTAGSAKSDFGNFSGNSGYSRSSGYSTRSSSSSSSSSRSSSYSGSSGSSGNSGSSGGYTTIPIPLGGGTVHYRNNVTNDYENDDDDDECGLSAIVFFGIVAIFLYKIIIGRKKAKQDRQILLDENSFPKIILEPIEEYSEIDPNFDENEIIAHLSNLYVQMQDAWTAKNIESLRPYFADVFYNQMNRQLNEYRKNNRTDHTERIAVLGVNLKGFRQAKGMDYIVAGLTARITTYVTDDLTGKVISGDKNKELFMEYEIELSRKTGIITNEAQEIQIDKCPNCGAPIDVNATAKCPYCGSIIKSQNINWAVCSMQGISQKTA